MTTAVQDRLELTRDELKTYFGITTNSLDAKIDLWIEAAKEEADQYMNNPFLKLGDDFLPVSPPEDRTIPSKVKLGVIEWVRIQIQHDSTTDATGPIVAGPVTEQKTGKATVKFGSTKGESSSGRALEMALKEVKNLYWKRYRLISVGFAGGY